ncbi:MAG: hypothetical protein M5U28_49430 [Sandaracinaceae bacterium]|nr:hypothetical protein [Sandaracinaceae bacterium]
MAEVFKAKTFGAEGFERLVAIKRILPHLVEDDDFVSMFIDEAKIAVRLQHPNIVGIHDLGRAEGTPPSRWSSCPDATCARSTTSSRSAAA